MSAGTPLLVASLLSLERGGRQLFSELSFEACPGELWQIVGDNGSGKTSLLRILAGLCRYGFDGRVARTSLPLYLGHLSAVKGLLTPRENLAWHIAGESEYSAARIESALASVGLYGYEDVPSHTLSAGQHRRVNLARLYLSDAPLWLLDEPFTAIDRQGVAALETLIETHVAEGGSVLLSSHQPLAVACPVRQLALPSGAIQ